MKRTWAVGAAVVAVLALGIALAAFDSGSSASHGPAELAYVTGAPGTAPSVWLATVSGQNRRRLGPGTTPLLSPDGTFVAASAGVSRGPALTLYGGGSPRQLFDATVQTAQPLAWSPDSRYLAVGLTGRDPASALDSGLVVIDTHTGAVHAIAHGVVHGASFAPGTSDRLAYAIAGSPALGAATHIYTVGPDGTGASVVTHDGVSLNPVWGPNGIAYDVVRRRTKELPAYQVWFAASGGRHRPLSDTAVPALRNGLVPLAFSADGGRLLAQYVGLDTSAAWTIALASGLARRVVVDGGTVTGAAISSDGGTLLVDGGGYLEPPSFGRVEAVPFGGGRAQVLVGHGADPTWNR